MHAVVWLAVVAVAAATPPEVDLRPTIAALDLNIRNQGNRNTASVYAMTFLLEFASQRDHKAANFRLSEEYLNWAANQVTGHNSDGNAFADLVSGYNRYRISPRFAIPSLPVYDPLDPPTPDASLVARLQATPRYAVVFVKTRDIKTQLRAGCPVAVALWWPSASETVTVAGVPLLKEQPRGNIRHAVDLVGFRESALFSGGGYFIYRNSRGTDFGESGYGYLSFQYLADYAIDAVAVVN